MNSPSHIHDEESKASIHTPAPLPEAKCTAKDLAMFAFLYVMERVGFKLLPDIPPLPVGGNNPYGSGNNDKK